MSRRPFSADDKPADYERVPCYPHADPDNPVKILRTVAFEAFRKEIEDYEYLKLLESTVVHSSQRFRVDPETCRAIREAQKWLAGSKHTSSGAIYEEGCVLCRRMTRSSPRTTKSPN